MSTEERVCRTRSGTGAQDDTGTRGPPSYFQMFCILFLVRTVCVRARVHVCVCTRVHEQ